MLSISKAACGGGQANYYLELAREDYYLEGGEPLGHWFGRGTKHLGVEAGAVVEKGDLRALFRGRSPEGEALVQNAGDDNRRSAWDLTFSAPKSVSTLWSQSDPEVRQKIQAAQERAVQAALSYLEDVAGFTRRGAQGKEIEEAKLTFAIFEHGTSRAQDPQLHTHALLLNIAVRDDGTTGAVTSEQIFQHKMAAGALYRAELATALVQELGIELEKDRQFFAVKGVSKELCEEFSKRRQEVEEALKEMGLDGAVAAKLAALATRTVKEHVAREDLFERWGQVGREHGWSQKEAEVVLGKNQQPTLDTEATAKLVAEFAMARIMTEQNYFTEAKLVRAAAEEAQLLGVSAQKTLAAVANIIKDKEIVEIGEQKGQTVYSTVTRLAEEKEILSLAEKSRDQSAHAVSEKRVESWLSKNKILSEEQRNAVRHITAGQGSIAVVSGMAGTGKTSMLSQAREIWEAEGYRVVGAALSGKAARGLEEGAGIKSATIARTEAELEKGSGLFEVREKTLAPHAGRFSPFYGVKIPVLSLRDDPIWLDSKTILVVDEGSMVETQQMKNLLSEANKVGAKVVLVGDERQLQAIGAGGAFKSLADRLGRAELTDIKRQTQDWARDLVRLFADGKAAEALEKAKELEFLSTAKDKAEACEKLIAAWKHKGVARPDEHLILAGTLADTEQLNTLAQSERRKAGELSRSKTVTVEDTQFYVGDRVLLTKNSKALGVENGTLATIEGINRKVKNNPMLEIVTDTGKNVRIPLKHYQDIELGYAVTTHKAQGMTTRDSYVLLTQTMQNRELSYVQASRASHFTRYFADCPEERLSELASVMSRSDQKELASDFEKRHQEQRAAQEEQERQRQAQEELRRQQEQTLSHSR